MNQKKISKSEAIGVLFSRAASENEMQPEAWNQQINDIIDIAKSANTLMCVYSADGCGKTTFLRQFSKKATQFMDVITINPVSPFLTPGWISHALAEWVSSDTTTGKILQQKVSALRESERPIIIAIDSGDLIDSTQMNGDISAVLNLGDASDLKISILVVCSERRAESLAVDPLIGNRLVLKNALSKLSVDDLVKITRQKLREFDSSTPIPSDTDLLNMAKNSDGSPMKMAHLICEHLGYDVPNSQCEKTIPKTPASSKKAKKRAESDMISIDDLLAPQTKD
jgi:hypothetical protein